MARGAGAGARGAGRRWGAPAPGRDRAGGPGPGGGAGGRRRGHGPGAALTAPRGRGAGGAGGLDWAAGPGRAGLGEAGRREPRPGLDPGPPRSRQRRAGRPGFKGAASPAAAASTARGRGGVAAPGIPPARPGTVALCVGSRGPGVGPPRPSVKPGRVQTANGKRIRPTEVRAGHLGRALFQFLESWFPALLAGSARWERLQTRSRWGFVFPSSPGPHLGVGCAPGSTGGSGREPLQRYLCREQVRRQSLSRFHAECGAGCPWAPSQDHESRT
ncbi:spidroin-1-like isoform X1 [Lutra lutra]|uniref:spidroin-1-like isoform X1 n=1 Tax=Lutra lutra TaxID=9657 RepID=UPI001FD506BF|nr:spidroin-1-like isoform X1 [Lutra lutra]